MIKDNRTKYKLKKDLGYYGGKELPIVRFSGTDKTVIEQVKHILQTERYLLVERKYYTRQQRQRIIKAIYELRRYYNISTMKTTDGCLLYRLIGELVKNPKTPKRTREYHTLGVPREALNGLYQGEIYDFTLKTVNDTDFVLKVFCGIPANKGTKNTMVIPDHVGKPTLKERLKFLFKGVL